MILLKYKTFNIKYKKKKYKTSNFEYIAQNIDLCHNAVSSRLLTWKYKSWLNNLLSITAVTCLFTTETDALNFNGNETLLVRAKSVKLFSSSGCLTVKIISTYVHTHTDNVQVTIDHSMITMNIPIYVLFILLYI